MALPEEEFSKNGYCVVRSALDKEILDFITQYTLFDEMQNFLAEDKQVPNAHSKYADPAMETVLIKLHDTIEKNTNLKLWPTYSYYRIYRENDILEPHKDRPSCEISATLCFNYSYDDNDYNWPIYMNGSKVILFPGDLVIYRGCDLEHWRERFDCTEKNCWHVQGFFHYVDQNGPFAAYKFDERSSIGLLKNPREHKKSQKKYIQYTK